MTVPPKLCVTAGRSLPSSNGLSESLCSYNAAGHITNLFAFEYLSTRGWNQRSSHVLVLTIIGGGLNDMMVALDIENAFTSGICLVEWPSRLIEKPVTRLDITLTIDSATLTTKAQVSNSQDNSDGDDNDSIGRLMQLVPHGTRWHERLRFLESEGYFDDLLV
jgi:hypothetical protein